MAGIAEAEASLTPRDHLIRIGLWTLVSMHMGAYFSQGDEGAQVLEHQAEFTDAILSAATGRSALENALERVSRGLTLNDTLKTRLLATPGFPERLLEIVQSSSCSTVARNHAVKALEAMSGSAEAQREMVRRGDHVRLVALMRRETTSLYARKALASTLCNLAQLPEHAAPLARAGVVGALVEEQDADPRLKRQRVAVSVARLALAADGLSAAELGGVDAAERARITALAAEERRAAAEGGALHSIKASLVESGVLLYLHTAVGGAAWGVFESVRLGESRAMLVQNVARTALVTCFVPILMVGGVVTTYTHVNKGTDSIQEKFALYFSSTLALYPAYKLLTWVERFAPLWLGGHVVGFGSFFIWTLYTESDLLKSDHDLLQGPQQAPPAAEDTGAAARRRRVDLPLNPFARIKPRAKAGDDGEAPPPAADGAPAAMGPALQPVGAGPTTEAPPRRA